MDILEKISNYYSEKISQHGDMHRGVDWNSEESQKLRFAQLCKVLPKEEEFSVNDLGCGYAAMYDFLQENFTQAHSYQGIDISKEMIDAAEKRFGKRKNLSLSCTAELAPADYTIASGIFNVRLETPDDEWLAYIESTLDAMNSASKKGFSFNILTCYSDREFWRDYLYYADPLGLFDRCCTKYSRRTALLQDYGLYEFTILVRKEAV